MISNSNIPPDGQFVGSGTFRVDRDIALQKLGKYQADDRVSRLSLWLRCAVASEAGYFSIKQNVGEAEIQFDGNSFSLNELSDPYQALFSRNAVTPRARWFAIAFLNAFTPSVKSVEIISGTENSRHLMRARERKVVETKLTPDIAKHTVVRIRWNILSLVTSRKHPLNDPISHKGTQIFKMTPIPIMASSQSGNINPITSSSKGFGYREYFVKRDNCRILIRRTANVFLTGDRFFVSTYGVTVGPIRGILRTPTTVTAWIDSPDVTLNASLSGAVENAQYKKLQQLLGSEIEKLVTRNWELD